jgi:hypothetical protein
VVYFPQKYTSLPQDATIIHWNKHFIPLNHWYALLFSPPEKLRVLVYHKQNRHFMKKVILCSLVMLCAAPAAFSQLGIKAGAALSTVNEDGEGYSQDDVEKKSVLTPVIGLTYDLNLSNVFTLQPELLFSQSGGRSTYNVLGTSTESTHRINYLELPVLAKLQLGNADGEGTGVYLAAGPFVGYAFSGKQKVVSKLGETVVFESEIDYFDENEDDWDYEAKRLNYGLVGAAGLTVGKVALDLRYNFGLNNLLDNDADNTNDSKPVLQTRGIALTLGYRF